MNTDDPIIERLGQIGPNALNELRLWLETWVRAKHITDTGGESGGIQFDVDNEGGSLLIGTSGVNVDGLGVEIVSSGGDIELDAPGHAILFTGTSGHFHFTGGATVGIALTADNGPVSVTASGAAGIISLTSTQISIASVSTNIAPNTGNKIGFFGAAPIVKPTGVAVTAAGIHAALVSLGLIAP